MQKHTFYRIINIIVLPVSVFIGLQVIGSLMIAFSNPPLLLMAFVMACVPIYAFTANYFYNKSIRKGEPCKASLKEWIKANAIVSIIFSVFGLIISLVMLAVLNSPELFNQAWSQLPPDATAQVSQDDFKQKLKILCYILLPFSIILLTHIIITFRLISRYRHMFGNSSNDPK
jgi:hypothetical protein